MSDRADTNESTSAHKKLKLRISADDLPSEIIFTADNNGIEIQNKNLNPEFIPMYLPEKNPRRKKTWLEKKQRKWTRF